VNIKATFIPKGKGKIPKINFLLDLEEGMPSDFSLEKLGDMLGAAMLDALLQAAHPFMHMAQTTANMDNTDESPGAAEGSSMADSSSDDAMDHTLKVKRGSRHYGAKVDIDIECEKAQSGEALAQLDSAYREARAHLLELQAAPQRDTRTY
jgi:hypothetical protein